MARLSTNSFQIGTEGGEQISVSIASSNINMLGAYRVTGDLVQASAGYGSGQLVNGVDADDDICINLPKLCL